MGKFKYENLDFQITKEGDLIFYKTSVPVVYQGKDTDYNFYLRNYPRKIESGVPLDGEIIFRC